MSHSPSSDPSSQWDRYLRHLCRCEPLDVTLDISRMAFRDGFLEELRGPMTQAFAQMRALEAGAIANPSEQRQVGHYWLRAPHLAPEPRLTRAILDAQAAVRDFAARVHDGRVRPERRPLFTRLLVIGIGGSALGPQLLADALGGVDDRLRLSFFDNTDPDGMDRVFAQLGDALEETLTLVISKSGGTKETRNGMLEAQRAYEARGLRFGAHAAAVTGEGSALFQVAEAGRWLATFPMWDWVGGRTSVTSAVGLLPAALQGVDVEALLEGARLMDEATRSEDVGQNPAALLALMWLHATGGRGARDMVMLPYKDRLILVSRYLQQLVMESLGKERDLQGRIVHQGISVYGNKGSTDQHAYVQQLRDGVPNFFVTFIDVLREREGAPFEVEPGITSGDYLHGFLLGTRSALAENGRESMTLTLPDVGARSLGALIALYERAVGLYASLVDINAYDQPGVEAGKKAAGAVLALQRKLQAGLATAGQPLTAAELAAAAGAPEQAETAWWLLERLAANPGRGVRREGGSSPLDVRFVAGA